MGKYNIDITTFREDLNYVNRKPSTVNYITNLEQDLTRRDFTINAICMNKDGKIIDPMHGCDDLDKRLIRMIGNIDEEQMKDYACRRNLSEAEVKKLLNKNISN